MITCTCFVFTTYPRKQIYNFDVLQFSNSCPEKVKPCAEISNTFFFSTLFQKRTSEEPLSWHHPSVMLLIPKNRRVLVFSKISFLRKITQNSCHKKNFWTEGSFYSKKLTMGTSQNFWFWSLKIYWITQKEYHKTFWNLKKFSRKKFEENLRLPSQ